MQLAPPKVGQWDILSIYGVLWPVQFPSCLSLTSPKEDPPILIFQMRKQRLRKNK